MPKSETIRVDDRFRNAGKYSLSEIRPIAQGLADELERARLAAVAQPGSTGIREQYDQSVVLAQDFLRHGIPEFPKPDFKIPVGGWPALVACRFCGSQRTTIIHRGDGFRGRCLECYAEGPLKPTDAEASGAWNLLAPQGTTNEVRDGLQLIVRSYIYTDFGPIGAAKKWIESVLKAPAPVVKESLTTPTARPMLLSAEADGIAGVSDRSQITIHGPGGGERIFARGPTKTIHEISARINHFNGSQHLTGNVGTPAGKWPENVIFTMAQVRPFSELLAEYQSACEEREGHDPEACELCLKYEAQAWDLFLPPSDEPGVLEIKAKLLMEVGEHPEGKYARDGSGIAAAMRESGLQSLADSAFQDRKGIDITPNGGSIEPPVSYFGDPDVRKVDL
jgi:hypothetical protein